MQVSHRGPTKIPKSVMNNLEGTWISGNEKQQIRCKNVNNGVLECTWPSQLVENFQIDSETLRGVKNSQICGYISTDGIINWNTGNQWMKEGTKLIIMFTDILIF